MKLILRKRLNMALILLPMVYMIPQVGWSVGGNYSWGSLGPLGDGSKYIKQLHNIHEEFKKIPAEAPRASKLLKKAHKLNDKIKQNYPKHAANSKAIYDDMTYDRGVYLYRLTPEGQDKIKAAKNAGEKFSSISSQLIENRPKYSSPLSFTLDNYTHIDDLEYLNRQRIENNQNKQLTEPNRNKQSAELKEYKYKNVGVQTDPETGSSRTVHPTILEKQLRNRFNQMDDDEQPFALRLKAALNNYEIRTRELTRMLSKQAEHIKKQADYIKEQAENIEEVEESLNRSHDIIAFNQLERDKAQKDLADLKEAYQEIQDELKETKFMHELLANEQRLLRDRLGDDYVNGVLKVGRPRQTLNKDNLILPTLSSLFSPGSPTPQTP